MQWPVSNKITILHFFLLKASTSTRNLCMPFNEQLRLPGRIASFLEDYESVLQPLSRVCIPHEHLPNVWNFQQWGSPTRSLSAPKQALPLKGSQTRGLRLPISQPSDTDSALVTVSSSPPGIHTTILCGFGRKSVYTTAGHFLSNGWDFGWSLRVVISQLWLWRDLPSGILRHVVRWNSTESSMGLDVQQTTRLIS